MVKFLSFSILVLLALINVSKGYQIGVGRADSTGPAAEIVFMGYANLNQKGEGIHLRQFTRTFIIDDGEQRVVFVNIDAAMMGNAVKRKVIENLQEVYGNLYTFDNVIISGTHTHGAPGGFLTHVLYDLPSLGFIKDTFNAYISGIVRSITEAHNNMVNGQIFISETEVLDANINRSPTSYLENPAEERAKYNYDVDKTLVQMKFVAGGRAIGAINWFAVHPTSMNNTNRLISSDNMGYASILLEQEQNPGYLPGKGSFVGAFAASNLGDVSPNIRGPKCEYTQNDCDTVTSSCPSEEGLCFASGPGVDMFDSTRIIASRIYEGASKLLAGSVGSSREVTGKVRFIHQYVDMTTYESTYMNENIRGCLPAMGYSFAAGTTDGPGAFDFTQGTTSDNAFWNAIRNFLASPEPEDIDCQYPKPILLATGRSTFPYEWQPKVVSTQVVQVGNVVLAAVPGEFTTMSGRRLRSTLKDVAQQNGESDVQVIVCGLSNMYTSYITTHEEYLVQRYEAASTIYGPHTLSIYLQQFSKLLEAMIKGENVGAGPPPANLEDDTLMSLQTDVVFDAAPIGMSFGSVRTQPNASYRAGETASALFVSGHPRNNMMHENSFMTVEKLSESEGGWKVIATDANWETKFRWERVSSIVGTSNVEISWTIPEGTESGTYRMNHYGYSLALIGGKSAYSGTTTNFYVE